RFMFQLRFGHADLESESIILRKCLDGTLKARQGEIRAVALDWGRIRDEVDGVRCDGSLLEYVAKILDATRRHPKLAWGSSIRGGMALVSSARLLALVSGRGFVTPDDVKALALPVLRHRLQLS